MTKSKKIITNLGYGIYTCAAVGVPAAWVIAGIVNPQSLGLFFLMLTIEFVLIGLGVLLTLLSRQLGLIILSCFALIFVALCFLPRWFSTLPMMALYAAFVVFLVVNIVTLIQWLRIRRR